MKHLLLLLALAAGLASNAQEQTAAKAYSLSLQQAIDHALQNNYSAVNASRDIEKAEQRKWETTASGLPQINAGVDYVDNFRLQQSLVPAEFFGGAPGEFIPVVFGTKHSVNARATLSQLLFDGSYIVALQASKTYLEYYRNQKLKSNNEIREAVVNAYGNVLLAEESIAILERNKAVLDKTLFDTNETFKNGLIEEENVEQLQITQASVNSNLNNARRLRNISYDFLKVALGIDLKDSLVLTDKLADLTAKNMDLAIASDTFDVRNNIDFKLGQNFVSQRTLEWKLERSKALPTLAANLNVGYNAFSNDFTFLEKEQDWFHYSSLGVSLNVPIFSSFGRRARTQQAKISLEQAKTQLTEVEQRLKLQYQNARSNYEFSVEEFATAKSNLDLAERIERKQQVKFTEGLSSSFDFAEAQRQLYAAQQSYLQSMIDVVNSRAALEKIINAN